jgi:hypothetical protein
MTNLMQQLQAWADRGAFKFPEGDDKGGFTMRKEDSNNPNIGAWELTPEQNFGIQCVLDGTIQVWRPVEHYAPKEGVPVMCLDEAGYTRLGKVYYFNKNDSSRRYNGACFEMTPQWAVNTNDDIISYDAEYEKITHWQPIAKPPQEVK